MISVIAKTKRQSTLYGYYAEFHTLESEFMKRT